MYKDIFMILNKTGSNYTFIIITLFFIIFLPFFFFKATPAAYGSSQATGLIGAVAASLCHSHSNVGSKPCLQPTPEVTATWDP